MAARKKTKVEWAGKVVGIKSGQYSWKGVLLSEKKGVITIEVHHHKREFQAVDVDFIGLITVGAK